MIIAGIDPGVSGALAVVNEDGDCETTDMPTLSISDRDMVDGAAVERWLLVRDVQFAVIEHAQAMPGNGVVGMFNYGQAFGTALGITQTLRIPYALIKPQLWKPQAGLRGLDKNASRDLASKRFPRAEGQFKRVKDHNRAEAALLAWWWQHRGSTQNIEIIGRAA